MLTLELVNEDEYCIPNKTMKLIMDCMTDYLRHWASSELGVSFNIDNSVNAFDEFMVIRNRHLDGDDASDKADHITMTMNTNVMDDIEFHQILMVHHKDGKVKTEVPTITNSVDGTEHDEFDPDTARLLTAVYTMYEFFVRKEIDFVVRYPEGTYNTCMVHAHMETISLLRRKVKSFCKKWLIDRAMGGKSAKVKKSRAGPY
jgi:hypothetical protein